MTNKKHGFTLAEILISLLILGVIASLTIPSLIQNTHKKEEIVKVKKGLSMINQAISMNYSLTGQKLNEIENMASFVDMLKKRLSVTEAVTSGDTMSYIKTQDGLTYVFLNMDGYSSNISFNPSEPMEYGNNFLEVSLITSPVEGYGNNIMSILEDYCNDLDVQYKKGCYEFFCDYDKCVPTRRTTAYMNAKDPTKVKWIGGQWVEQ